MRIRQLLIATASIGFLFDGAGAASAGPFGMADKAAPAAAELPQACVDAGAKTAAECEALMHKAKEPAAPAAAAPAEPAPAEAAAPAQAAPAEPAPPPKPARHAQPEPDAAPAAAPAEPARAPKPAEAAAPAAEAPADAPAVKPRHAPPSAAEAAAPGEPDGQPAAEGTVRKPHRPPAPDATPVAPVVPAAAAPVAPAEAAPVAPAAAPGAEPRVHGARLPKDCVAAGIQSKADCDALHANGAAAKPAPATPEAVTPAPSPFGMAQPPARKPPPAAAAPAAPAPAAAAPQPAAPPVAPATPQAAGPFGMKLDGVPPAQVAPLFDSAKDAETNDGATAGKPARPQHQRPAGPPPANDQAAQTGIQPPTIQPIDKTQGQQIDLNANQPIGLQLPPGARVVQPSADDRFRPGGPGDRRGHRPGGPGAPQGGPDFAGGPPAAPDPLGLALGAIVQLGDQLIINSPGQDQRRISGGQGDRSNYERLPGNRYRETVTRPNGVRIVTVYDQSGDVLRRSRFDRTGHETVLAYFDARDDNDLSDWHDPGDDLPPLQSDIAPRDYVLDADQASESQVQRFFAQPPVEQVQRLYSIDEVKRSARIRDMVRRLEIGDLTFDTGAATISEDQVQNLDTVSKAMLALLHRNPGETFLIEGHTDAVGSDIANLQLSDARAATVAEILTDFYHIPPENLATQGYGERFLIVQTDGPERLNRRVTIRRITPLITVADQPY